MDGTDKQHFPINLKRLIKNVRQKFKITSDSISDLDPIEIIERVAKLKDRMIIVIGKDKISIEAQKNARSLFNIHMTATLSPKKLILKDRLNEAAFN